MERDIRAEAQRFGDRLVAGAAPGRLMGGLAVWLRSPTVRRPPFAREYGDLDLVAPSAGRVKVQAFLEAEGYLPDRRFNALHGAQRLYYSAPDGSWSVDVIFDRLAMSHVLDLRARLGTPEPTLPLADLLLTKLQIWEINRKDLVDAMCLIGDHDLADGREESIAVERIASVLGADWGFCHTVERNLCRIEDLAAEHPRAFPRNIDDQVEELRSAIGMTRKTIGWKARARIGERVQWYDTPEEVAHEER